MLVARSLAQQAALLLLDEPASQLDPANRVRVTALLRRLADRGMAVVYTSHDPQAAAAAADTVHLLSKGRFAFSGTAAPDAHLRSAPRRLRRAVPRDVDPPRAARQLGRVNDRQAAGHPNQASIARGERRPVLRS